MLKQVREYTIETRDIKFRRYNKNKEEE